MRDGEGPVPPVNLAAEQALLGCILQRNTAYEGIAGRLKPEHFAEAIHGRIYEAIEAIVQRGGTASAITIGPQFDADPALAERGGRAYIFKLQGFTVSTLNAKDYGESVLECWQRRQIMEIAEEAAAAASHARPGTVTEIIRETEDSLYHLAEPSFGGTGLVRAGASAAKAIERAEAAYKAGGDQTGVDTGLYDLDKRIGGLMPSEFVVLAGRPSMGKTALAGTIIRNAARKFMADALIGKPPKAVYFHSAEMPAVQVAYRDLADLTGISAHRQRLGQIEAPEFDRLVQAQHTIEGWPYFVDDTPQVGVAYIRHRARHIQRKHGLGLIVVDHLQKLKGTTTEGRRLEIDELSGGLAALAKELDVPVLALSQLSRAVEARDDKRPNLSDLRESGGIEQDADVVMFLYREAFYLERNDPKQGTETEEKFAAKYADWCAQLARVKHEADVIVAKVRQGPPGVVPLIFDGELSRFRSKAAQQQLLDYAP
jgi:replicative DNA helicase